MSVSRVIEVSFGNETVVYVNIDTAYYYNDGVIIKPTDGDLPDTYQVHWADSPEAQTTLETIGTSEGVPVPDELWGRSKVIYGWFYLHPTEDSSVTYKEIRIYKSARAGLPDGTEPTPSEHSTIDQLISAMNTAADKAEQNADSASSDADRAETARNEAETYAVNAQTSASNAEASATTATNQAQIATTSATTATTAAQTATAKATEASNSASSAAESASSASKAADSASRSEQAAKISETNAADSESNASTYANSARGYAQTAQSASASASSSATSASNSATSASNSATSASQSAGIATEAKADVEGMVDDAQGYASASAQSASQASASEQGCARAVLDAASAAAIARARAEEASGYAQTASTKATEASTSAQTASQKATEASQSATNASQSAQTAESAKTASQTAQGKAEDAQTAAETAQGLAESARDDAVQAKDDAESAVASINSALIEKAPVITDTASGAIASFSDGADDLPLKSLVIDINPIQDLHGQESPYPAGGGINSFNKETVTPNSIINGSGEVVTNTVYAYAVSDYIAVAPNTAYYFKDVRNSSSGYAVMWYDTDKAFISDATIWAASGDTASASATAPSNARYVRVCVPNAYIDVCSVNYPSTDTSYHPYENICPISGWTEVNVNHSDADTTNPTTITISLGQTVYGGKLDVLSGELVIDRAMVDLGALGWYYIASRSIFEANLVNAKPFANTEVATVLCSQYVTKTYGNVYINAVDCSIAIAVNSRVYVYDSAYTDVTAFKTAMDGVMACYELAEPIEIQLTPNQINSLLGVNNIWADSGDTSAEYRADTKLYIAKKIAEAISALS